MGMRSRVVPEKGRMVSCWYYGPCGLRPISGINIYTYGSIRVWRGLRYNEKYAITLQKKLAKRQAQAQAKIVADVEKKSTSISNPFLVSVHPLKWIRPC